jgi:hypothetical protein
VDAIGGTSLEAHRAGLERVVQAGAQPISWVSLACERRGPFDAITYSFDVLELAVCR